MSGVDPVGGPPPLAGEDKDQGQNTITAKDINDTIADLKASATDTQQQTGHQASRLGTLLHPAADERGIHNISGGMKQQSSANEPPQTTAATATAEPQQLSQSQLMAQVYLQQQMQEIQRQAQAKGQQLTNTQLQQIQTWFLLQRQAALSRQQQQLLSLAGPVSAARTPGEAPPAKRQAFSAQHAQAQHIAQNYLQQLFQTGQLAQLNAAQQSHLYQTIYSQVCQQLGISQVSHGSYRKTVDRKNRLAGDKLFQAIDTTGKDHADEVVRQCEEISRKLRSHLGKSGRSADEEGRYAGTHTDDAFKQVTQQQLIDACGDTARYLKPYQLVGINFLLLLYKEQIGGAILADEMGLGKTAQLINYMGTLKKFENDPGPHLVVVPASLLENWQRELRRWCPSLISVVYYGKNRFVVRKRLRELRARLEAGEDVHDDLADLQDVDLMAQAAASEKAAALAAGAAEEELENDDDPYGLTVDKEDDADFDVNEEHQGSDSPIPTTAPPPPQWNFSVSLPRAPFNVMLTSYTLFERDSQEQREDRLFLESWSWSHLIMDEAHALKNRNAQRTTRLRRIANRSRRRIMMTGTPLQNDLAELQNLMHFLLPQIFASSGFENYADMIQGDEAEVRRLTERMKQLLGPFVLRRLKTEVAGQLTEKKHSTEFIKMTPEQEKLYKESLSQMRSQLVASNRGEGDGDGEATVEKFVKSIGAKKISHMFTHLRKIAQHPLLIRHHYDDATVEEIARLAYQRQAFGAAASDKKIFEELMTYSDYRLHAFCYNQGMEFAEFCLNSRHMRNSAKFKFLADLLPKLKEAGSRPLIFSQWTAVLDVIEWLMDELRLPYVRLDGSTAVDDRLATVDQFNTSEDVFAFLLSTRAGGQGLNLTGADTVILHDVDFNPQIDRQAEDRCHRLGQTKPVMVYRLVTRESVDQNIYDLSQRKLKLDAAVLTGITSGRGARQREAAQERHQMSNILHSLVYREMDYDAMIEDHEKAEEEDEIKAEEVLAEELKPEEVLAEELKAEEAIAEELKPEEVMAEELKPEEAMAEELKPEEVQAQETEAMDDIQPAGRSTPAADRAAEPSVADVHG